MLQSIFSLPCILFLAFILLVMLLFAEHKESMVGKLIFKPLLSTLFVATACLQPWSVWTYAVWLLAGLVLSWIGDLCLIFKPRTMFLSGLIAFLLGHVCYTMGFFTLGAWHLEVAIGLAVALIAGGAVFFWLSPHLGKMKGPVIAYIVIISTMVGGALALFSAPGLGAAAKWQVLIGALLFYASDLFVARDQFVKSAFANRLIGLPLYYSAQFLLAFSVGAV